MRNIYNKFYPQNGGENQLAQIWIEITSLSPYVLFLTGKRRAADCFLLDVLS